jgi:hypothetical protein
MSLPKHSLIGIVLAGAAIGFGPLPALGAETGDSDTTASSFQVAGMGIGARTKAGSASPGGKTRSFGEGAPEDGETAGATNSTEPTEDKPSTAADDAEPNGGSTVPGSK